MKKPSSDRLAALRSLPRDVLHTLTQDEIHSFLHDEEWPDSLREKLKQYIVGEDQNS
jgi:hypothetical protein